MNIAIFDNVNSTITIISSDYEVTFTRDKETKLYNLPDGDDQYSYLQILRFFKETDNSVPLFKKDKYNYINSMIVVTHNHQTSVMYNNKWTHNPQLSLEERYFHESLL